LFEKSPVNWIPLVVAVCRIGEVRTNWTRLVRAVVHSEYFLRAFDSEQQGAGLFRASDSAGKEVHVHLLSAEATDAAAFQERWSAVAALSHAGLLRTLAFGTVRIDGADFLCAVAEAPEERLTDVLAVRSLTPDETREVLESTVAALTYLHEHKYLHGAFGIESIIASDGRAKLTTATLRRFSPSNPDDRAAFVREIKQVGNCTLRMLSKPGQSRPAPGSIPTEFTMLLRTASMGDERWTPTAIDLLDALNGVNIEPAGAAPAEEETAAAQPATPATSPPVAGAPSSDGTSASVAPPPSLPTAGALATAAPAAVPAPVPAAPRRQFQPVLVPALAFLAIVVAIIYSGHPHAPPPSKIRRGRHKRRRRQTGRQQHPHRVLSIGNGQEKNPLPPRRSLHRRPGRNPRLARVAMENGQWSRPPTTIARQQHAGPSSWLADGRLQSRRLFRPPTAHGDTSWCSGPASREPKQPACATVRQPAACPATRTSPSCPGNAVRLSVQKSN
jgi:hypothetical protein